MNAKKSDDWATLKSIVKLVVNGFSAVMACMLSIFVPQVCRSTNVVYDNDYAAPLCNQSIIVIGDYVSQNYLCFVFTWNVITVITVCLHHFVIWQREGLLIRRLHNDPNTAARRLPDVLGFYSETSSLLYKAHCKSFAMTVILSVIIMVNIASSIYLCHLRYAGTQTITVFITNTLLLVKLIYECIDTLLPGLKENIALSLFFKDPTNYNVIDIKYVDPRDVSIGGRIEQEDPMSGMDIPIYEFRHLEFPANCTYVPEPCV